MHAFTPKRGQLYCERVPVERIADDIGTPVYIYSTHTLLDHFRKLKAAFKPVHPLICFSVKANGNLAIMRLLVRQGAGLDIVSGGELFKALKAGCPPERIVFASVGKSRDEIRDALKAGIFCFNVESVPELHAINEEARAMRKVARVALRVNPDVQAHTHHYITTGIAESKFGIDLDVVRDLVLRRFHEFGALQLMGFHLHIGSQITNAAPFVKAIQRVGALIEACRKAGIEITWLNLGGGLGIVYKDERPQTAQAFATAVLPLLTRYRVKLILEPGRFIVGNAGILVARVLYLNPKKKKQFVVVDAGMNDLIRPALYQAYHDIIPVHTNGAAAKGTKPYDVVGPVCESADVFGRDRALPPLAPGQLVAVMGAGAYGFVMASNYNGRPRPAEVLVNGNTYEVVRQRETLQDLIRHDRIPAALSA